MGEPRPRITSLETWREHGGPKAPVRQWVEFRSAYELARAWCAEESGVRAPPDFLALLHSNRLLAGLELTEGYAEHETPLRGERGGPRNHDLLLIGHAGDRKVVIGVEGKADETFDESLEKRWSAAQKKLAAGKPTKWPERLGRLVPALLGLEATTEDGELNPSIAGVPYQLLSAVAGTLVEADDRGAGLAVFVVHGFRTRLTSEELVAVNDRALTDFIARLRGGKADAIRKDRLYGPFHAHARPLSRIPSGIPYLIGGLTTDLRGVL